MGCCIEGSGSVKQREVYVSSFSQIEIDLPAAIHVRYGEQPDLFIQTDENILDHIHSKVNGDTLFLTLNPDDCCIEPTVLNVYVSMQQFEGIRTDGSVHVMLKDSFDTEHFAATITGAGELEMRAPLRAETIEFNVDGSGRVSGELYTDSLMTSLDGTARIILAGSASYHLLDVDGAATVNAFHLNTSHTEINLDGSAHLEVQADDRLDVSIDGIGEVYYSGNPEVEQQIDGIGSVRQMDVN